MRAAPTARRRRAGRRSRGRRRAGSRRRLAPSAPRGARRRPASGTAAHMPCVELRAERLDERLVLLGAPRRRPRRSAPRRGPASCAGTSSRERLWQSEQVRARVDARGRARRWRRSAASRAMRVAPAQAEDVDGSGAGAELAQPVARPPGRRPPRAWRAASSGSSPSASRAASVEECVQPEPCAAPSGWRSPGSSVSVVAVEEEVGRRVAVAAGDDDGRAARARGAPRASASPSSVSSPRERARLRRGSA